MSFLNECLCFFTYWNKILYNKPIINTLSWSRNQLGAFSYISSIDAALSFEEPQENKIIKLYFRPALSWQVFSRNQSACP